MATLEITADVAVAPLGSGVWASTGLIASAMLARVKQPYRRAGRVVFIADLLHSNKFVYLPGARRAFQTHPCPTRETKRRPSQSFLLFRQTTDRLRDKFGFAKLQFGGSLPARDDHK